MFKVNTPQGERFMVQLVGPSSYRMNNQITYRGQCLTVQRRTRDYLVRQTNGAWKDYDPTPAQADFDPVFPPQFGREGGPRIDMDDIDPKSNPAISMEHALQLAAQGGEVATNMPDYEPEGLDTADLDQAPSGAPEAPSEAGDMSSADLKTAKAPGAGGKTAEKTGGVKVTTKATPKPVTGAVLVE